MAGDITTHIAGQTSIKSDKPVIFRWLIRTEHQLQCKLVIFTEILGIKITEIFTEQAIHQLQLQALSWFAVLCQVKCQGSWAAGKSKHNGNTAY